MWEKVGLLGRDDLLSKKIKPRLNDRTGFVLLGQHGIGKTALLGWCMKYAKGRKSLISATSTVKEMLIQICVDWEISPKDEEGNPLPKSKWLVPALHQTILGETGGWIMIDDIQRITPAALQKLKPMRDRHLLVCAGIPPLRKDELKRLLWGLKYIEVGRINKSDMKRLAHAAAPLVATKTPVIEAVHSARGIPAMLFHALRGEVTPDTAKTKDEEIDISPAFLVLLAGIMFMRYLARGLDSSAMMMLSGAGTALMIIARFWLFKGMRK